MTTAWDCLLYRLNLMIQKRGKHVEQAQIANEVFRAFRIVQFSEVLERDYQNAVIIYA